MGKRVSIIIPAYNAASYILDCLTSVLSQEHVTEVIVVNDGSTDETPAIMQSVKDNDNRVLIIDRPNEGVSAARNLGMDLCSGDYILFVDADDVLPRNAVSTLLALAISTGADITYGEYAILQNGAISSPVGELSKFSSIIISPRSALMSMASIGRESISGSCWRILFSNCFLKRALPRFPRGIAISEDYDFMLMCFTYDPRIAVSHEIVYLLRRDGASVTQKWISSLASDQKLVNDHLLKACLGDAELMARYNASVSNTAWGICTNSYKPGSPLSAKQRFSLICSVMNEYGSILKTVQEKDGLPKGKLTLLKMGAMCPLLLWCILELRSVMRRG